MKMYNAEIELDTRETSGHVLDALMNALRDYHVAVGTSPERRLAPVISFPAESLPQAVTTALGLASGLGHEVVSLHVLASEDFDRRLGLTPLPSLVSVSEAADMLGVRRQAVQQLIESGTLPGTKVGSTWVVPHVSIADRLERVGKRERTTEPASVER